MCGVRHYWLENFPHSESYIFLLQVIIKDKVLELLLYFTKHEDEEVKTKAIIGLGKHTFSYIILILISIGFIFNVQKCCLLRLKVLDLV